MVSSHLRALLPAVASLSTSATPGAFEENVKISGVPKLCTHFNQNLLSLYFTLWPVYVSPSSYLPGKVKPANPTNSLF